MPFFKYLDDDSDITDITFRDRKRFAPIDKFSHLLLRGESALTIPEREMIAAYISKLNACSFCHGIHTEVASRFGIRASLIDELVADIDRADVSPKFVPLLKYVKKLTLTPARVTEQDANAVYAAGWSEDGLYDAICICCLFNFYNRLLDGHGIKGNKSMYDHGAGHLFKRGYSVPWFIKYIKGFLRKKRVEKINAKRVEQ